MTDRVALHLNDDWAITFDANQWIVCKARKLRSESKLHPQAFIGSTRTTLARVLRENGVVIDVKAQVVMDTLTPKQSAFVDEYLVDLNATQAAIRAGYSEKTAKDIGYQNLAKLYIVEAIVC